MELFEYAIIAAVITLITIIGGHYGLKMMELREEQRNYREELRLKRAQVDAGMPIQNEQGDVMSQLIAMATPENIALVKGILGKGHTEENDNGNTSQAGIQLRPQ